MSEGPEVRRTADRLSDALVGRRVTLLELRTREGLNAALRSRVVGSQPTEIRTYGKHLVIAFDSGVFLHNHMMMWGKWRVYDRGSFDAGRAAPPPRVSRGPLEGPTVPDVRDDSRARLFLGTDSTVAVEFNGPLLRFTDTNPATEDRIRRLGPDALRTRFPVERASRRLHERTDMTLADLLLDQTFVAGVGNKYKSEILFLERLHPFLRARDLTRDEETRLIRAIPRVLRFGYEHAGRTRMSEEGESGNRWETGHWVFRRGGRPCRRCGTAIATDRRSSARVTYLCPTCQSLRAPRTVDAPTGAG